MITDLINRLQKCPEYSCSRCVYYKTPACAMEEAVRELRRYNQILDISRETSPSTYESLMGGRYETF